MASINELKGAGLFKFKLYPREAFDQADASQAPARDAWGESWVELREMSGREQIVMNTESDPVKRVGVFLDLLPKLIVAHSWGEEAKTAEVVEVITQSQTVSTFLMTEWINRNPLLKKSAQKSGSALDPSSPVSP